MTLYLAYDDCEDVASFEVVNAVSELDACKLTHKKAAIKLTDGLKFQAAISTDYGESCSSEIVVHS